LEFVNPGTERFAARISQSRFSSGQATAMAEIVINSLFFVRWNTSVWGAIALANHRFQRKFGTTVSSFSERDNPTGALWLLRFGYT
jgi:hypothetical protein